VRSQDHVGTDMTNMVGRRYRNYHCGNVRKNVKRSDFL
jgi:hypothetical protein